MAAQLNDTVGIYPQQYEEKKMEERIQAILKERFGRDLDNCTKSEIFEALMVITKQEMAVVKETPEIRSCIIFQQSF